MNTHTQELIRKRLVEAIETAIKEASEAGDLPYHGEGMVYLMADAALIVIKALDDCEEHLRSDGIIPD